MKRIVLFVVLFMFASSFASAQEPATPQNPGTGVGIIVGDPTGISLKHWMSSSTAWDAALAWSLDDDESFNLHVDYLVHDFDSLKVDSGRLAWYYGVGGRFVVRDGDDHGRGNDDDDSVGIRVPVGLDYFIAKSPLDVFLEIAPVLDLVPETDLDFDIGIGIRFNFR